mgnify:CR=1 FL=1
MNKKLIIYITFIFLIVGCNNIKNEAEIKGTKVEKTDVISDQVVPNQKLNKEQQIASALFAAPLEAREGAMVYGYDKDGNFVILREGHNEIICIADDPNKDGFEVVSYHNQLEPYMARGRELKETGKSHTERRDIREKEAIEKSLAMPKNPSTLHILYGKNGLFDIDSSKVRNVKYRYVVYIPFATQASTGLSLSPNAPGHPWLMFPGKANAHIMISPKD